MTEEEEFSEGAMGQSGSHNGEAKAQGIGRVIGWPHRSLNSLCGLPLLTGSYNRRKKERLQPDESHSIRLAGSTRKFQKYCELRMLQDHSQGRPQSVGAYEFDNVNTGAGQRLGLGCSHPLAAFEDGSSDLPLRALEVIRSSG